MLTKRVSNLISLTAVIISITVVFSTATVSAFNPPQETAGPLTVKIDGPESVAAMESPLAVGVVLSNKGDAPVAGKLRLAVVDRWRIEPSGEIDFAVPAGATITKQFSVVAGQGTYSAHYPIHAYAEFSHNGKALTVHPILILETKLPPEPTVARPIPWKPFPMSEQGELALWQLPVRRVVVAVGGEKPLVMPVGWQGTEPRSKACLNPGNETIGGDSRAVMFMHPPWADGHVGRVAVEYPLALPKSGPIGLGFANAIHPAAERSDGVTFRVRVLPFDAADGDAGEVLFERHIQDKTWQDARVDLSRFAGQNVRVQLESDPGPKNDTAWDHSLWVEPTLLVGKPRKPMPFPPGDTKGSIFLGAIKGEKTPCEVRLWPGERGLLDAVVAFSDGKTQLAFQGFEIRVRGVQLQQPGSPTRLIKCETKQSENQYEVRHDLRDAEGETFSVIGRLWIENGALRAQFRLTDEPKSQPWRVFYLEDVAVGAWSSKVRQLYAGDGNVIRNPGRVDLGFEGHQLSTSYVGFNFEDGFSLIQAVDVPCDGLTVRPDDRHYSLHAPHASTLTFIPGDNVWDGVKTWRAINGLKPAGGVKKLAGRFVFDLWGGRYKESTEALKRSFRYGLTDAAVVWHNWQRWGYDYRLPDICPPNPDYGTLDEMRALSETCRRAGVLFAPHDNYIDFYPDADGFSYEKNIAFSNADAPVRAWLNEGRKAQSYRYRPDRTAEYLQANVRRVKENLAPTAYFIDVWSSACPYDYWTADGRFGARIETRDTWAAHFAWIRAQLGDNAPQISESGHDQLIGFLDGAQTNHLRVGKPLPGYHNWCVWNVDCDDAERIAWFDFAHHDRFICHGAGYPGRYEGGLDSRLHGIYSDDYIATEVLTGHPAMVSQPFGRDVVRKYWLLSDLMRALALRTIERVEFVDGDIHRQRIDWSGGGRVWVNRGKSDWMVEGRVLPEFGFFATVPTERGKVEASIERREGVIVESARSPESIYVNGRHFCDGLTPKAADPNPLLARFNLEQKPVDFDGATTEGGCRIIAEDQTVRIVPLPNGREFTLKIAPELKPAVSSGWDSSRWKFIEALDEEGRVIGRDPIVREGGKIVVKCKPDVFAYRPVE